MRTMKLTFAVFLPALMLWSCSMGVAKEAKEAADLECQAEKLDAEYKASMAASMGVKTGKAAVIEMKAKKLGEKFNELKDRIEEKYKDDEAAQIEFQKAFREAKKKCGS